MHSINTISNADLSNLPVVDKNDEYLIYQALIGIWETEKMTSDDRKNLVSRLENYILKFFP